MTVILSGIRGSDGTPLVLVRCRCSVRWIDARAWAIAVRVKPPVHCNGCGAPVLDPEVPTLAQADREREGAADAA